MRRFWLCMLSAVVLLGGLAYSDVPAGRIELELWFSLRGPLYDAFSAEAMRFNESQDKYWVNPVWKGTYPEVLSITIAAIRAGEPPHMVQVFEVGTATVMAMEEVVYPIADLMADTGTPFDATDYIPGVAGYYSLPDGRVGALAYNSSTTVMWYNKDAFRAAGLDPEQPPATWAEVREAATAIRDAGAASVPVSSAWPTWALFEQMSALHNMPLGSKGNGFDGLDAELMLELDFWVDHLQLLLEMQQDGTFVWGGRDAEADGLFPAGEAAMLLASSGLRARIEREADFDWGVTFLPYHDDVVDEPYNSILGGAALWALRPPQATEEHFQGMAEYFAFLTQPENIVQRHMDTGYMPITFASYEYAKEIGYYDEVPAAEIPVQQLLRTETVEHSRGIRLGNMPAIRVIMYEELERAFAGRLTETTARDALARMTARGNQILRDFEAIYAD